MNLKIGELARLAGCLPVTIRFYEKKGLLKNPERTSANYRLYDKEDINRLRFILHCRQNGINLADIRKLLLIRDGGGGCNAVHSLIDNYLQQVNEQIAALKKLHDELEKLREAGLHENGEGCSILATLSNRDDCEFCSCLNEKTRQTGESAAANPEKIL